MFFLYAVLKWRFGEIYWDTPRATALSYSRTEFDCVQYLRDARKSIGIFLRRCSLISEPEGGRMLHERFFLPFSHMEKTLKPIGTNLSFKQQ